MRRGRRILHLTKRSAPTTPANSVQQDSKAFMIPAGTKIPLVLKQAISTKNAREGDAVYAATAFPYVVITA